jgi:hypothetical protein
MRPDWADQVHDHAGFCEGLPFFLTDLRPQGYLGRATARRLPGSLGLPLDPREWSDDQTLFYLREWGDDLPGNLTLGDGPTGRALNACPSDPITPETRATRYPELAAQANAGEPVGSSVEGEQPKFTAWLRLPNESWVSSVLVKFTDRLDTPTGRRWADLLAAEAVALDVLTWASRGGAEANHPQTFDFADRRFYELPRFDRVGSHGRRGVVSLRALHDAGFSGGDTNDWAVAAAGLRERGWIGESDLRAVRLRRLFGRLIGNTDMHFGNLAFFLEPELPLRLAPTYDPRRNLRRSRRCRPSSSCGLRRRRWLSVSGLWSRRMRACQKYSAPMRSPRCAPCERCAFASAKGGRKPRSAQGTSARRVSGVGFSTSGARYFWPLWWTTMSFSERSPWVT